MSGSNFNAQMNEMSNSFSAHLEEITTIFNVEFGDFITLYRGVVRVWIGNGTNGEDGVLYAEMVDGVVQNLGPVTGYYYARQVGFQGTFVEWVLLLLNTTVNAQNAAQSASEALASEQAAASSEAAAAASEVSAEQWATGGTGATYSSGKSAKEQADRAAMWAAGTSSGNGSATNNAKYWSDLAQTAKNTAVSAKDAAVASEAVAVAKASDSEAWAVGQRGGSDVPSTDQTYQNNSKYYAEIAVAGRRWIAYNWDDDPTRAFEVGEFVTKDDTIYMFISPHAANTPWSLNEVEVTNLGALLKDLQDNVVLVQQEEPTSENNKIWLKPSNVEVSIPTYEEFVSLGNSKVDEPASEGTSGQVLTTDGNGGRSWTTVQGGGSANVTYVTPEDYGAVGDGVTDDTTAIQAAIDYGRTNGTAVRGFNVYKTTGTLLISGNYMDVDIHRLKYTGSSNALTVKGSYHQLKFGSIYCNSGAGVVYKADTVSVMRNNFTAGRIYCANGHCVDLQTSNSYSIYYNTFNIRDISSDTGNCYNGNNLHEGENVYYNSSCHCQNGWAIYHLNGRFYNFTLEGDVLNGICLKGGYNYYAGFRIRELVDKLVRRMSGLDPSLTGGTLIKYDDANYCISKFVCDDFVPYDAVDVSSMITPEEELAKANPDVNVLRRLTYYNEIDAPIRVGYYGSGNGYFTPGHKMIIQGGRKICVPDYEVEYTITDAEYDLRDPIIDANTVKIYPTRMVIGVDDCEIYLPSSYNPIGYSSFIVDQSSHTCTIYDYNDDNTPIFNGAVRGNGVFKLTAYTNLDDNAIQRYTQSSTYKQFDSSNYYWKVERIDISGGSGSGGGVVSVADYGAVGDGVTDDSGAIQDAINANYDVYFESDKTYYLASSVTISHDVHLHGGKNTKIKTATPLEGTMNNAFVCSGTLKKTTALTGNYSTIGTSDNSGNMFTLTDMTGINIGDILVIEATDQYYSYARQYYYLGGVLLVSDVYDNHIFTSNSLPFDITNSQYVSAKVYSAPEVIIENLHFTGDQLSRGHLIYFVKMSYCKNSIVRNCHMTNMDSGLSLQYCVNSVVDNVSVSKSKDDNSLTGDGYGIYIFSCSNTEIRRVTAICAQGCLDLGGFIPNIDTFVRECNLNSECRAIGIDMHENSYNIVVEDCTLGGLSLYGTAEVNRCRFIKNNRVPTTSTAIVFRGSHDERWAKLHVSNCVFDGDLGIQLMAPSPQSPIQAFDNVFGKVLIENCDGGELVYNPTVSSSILSHTVNELIIKSWKNCRRFLRTSVNYVKHLVVADSTFRQYRWITDNNAAHGLYLDGIDEFSFSSVFPEISKISIDKDTMGEARYLPGGIPIQVSSANSSAKFIVCGDNLVSDTAADYVIGSVTGNSGGDLTRTAATGGNLPTVSIDSNGNLVFSQGSGTGVYAVYPNYMAYIREVGTVELSATLKNTGATSGAAFYPYIAVVNCKTGKVKYRENGTKQTATAQGVEISHSCEVDKDSIVLFYFSCSDPVASSESTFEDLTFIFEPLFNTNKTVVGNFVASRRTGDGAILSVEGFNNIMSSELNFHIKLKADRQSFSGSALTSGEGVSF